MTGSDHHFERPSSRNVAALFEDAARLAPDKPFIVSRSIPAESCTFASFLHEARALARHVVAAGIAPGDRVALLCENRPRWCVAHASILLAGGVAVPLDAGASADLIARILDDSGAKAVLTSGSLRARCDLASALRDEASTLRAPLPMLSLDDDASRTWSQLIASAVDVQLPALEGGERPAAILYTSGTTGSPKGVVLTHENLLCEVESVREGLAFRADDVLILFLPLQHVLTQVGSYLLPASMRLRVVHASVTRGEDLVAAVREDGVTILLAVPLLFQLLHERIMKGIDALSWPLPAILRTLMRGNAALVERAGVDLGRLPFGSVHRAIGPRLRLLVSGGAPLSLRVQRDFIGMGFRLVHAYGLTESAGGSVFARPEEPAPGTVGKPLPRIDLRIDAPGADGVGEICLKGPQITPGYHGRPEESAAILREGWLHTGDLGSIDARGNLRITGRIKDVIISPSGKNVYPEDIESHYARCPSIKELCVVGRPSPGGDGETLHAIIVPDDDALRARGVTSVRDEIRFEVEGVSIELPTWQRLLSFELRSEPLPRTATKKIQRFLVKAAAHDMGDDAPRREADAPVDDADCAARQELREGRIIGDLISTRIGGRAIVRGRSSFELDLGLDSLSRMELLLEVERALGVSISDDEASGLAVVDDLVKLVLAKGPCAARARESDAASWSELVAQASAADLPSWFRPRRSRFGALVVRASVSVAALLAKMFFRLRVRGVEHVPREGAFLICPNHVSVIDGFIMGCALPPHAIESGFALGELDYVSGPLVTPLARFFSVVPTSANRSLRETMRLAAAGLKEGRILLIFPEGVRSADGRLGEIKLGAPILAAELDLPIVPALIEGAFEAWPRGKRLPRPRPISVTFGPPLHPREVGDSAALAQALRQAWIALGGK